MSVLFFGLVKGLFAVPLGNTGRNSIAGISLSSLSLAAKDVVDSHLSALSCRTCLPASVSRESHTVEKWPHPILCVIIYLLSLRAAARTTSGERGEYRSCLALCLSLREAFHANAASAGYVGHLQLASKSLAPGFSSLNKRSTCYHTYPPRLWLKVVHRTWPRGTSNTPISICGDHHPDRTNHLPMPAAEFDGSVPNEVDVEGMTPARILFLISRAFKPRTAI